MLKCIRTGFRQRLRVIGLQPYSHASASTSRTNDKKSGTRAVGLSQGREGYTKKAPVSTLDQRKLLPTDWLDLSGRMQLSINFRNKLNRDCEWRVYYRRPANKRLPFPPCSSGFFYYHQPPGAPLLSGELRFRVTSNNLPESFDEGEDCLTPEGDPWKIPLFVLHHIPFHQNVYQQLRVDGFVSDALDSQLKSIAQTYVCPRNTSIVLHSLHQVFPIDFSATTFRFFVAGDSTLQNVLINYPFRLGRQGRASSYTSKGLVRFELSALPEHAGTRTVVMRVVKLVGDPGPYIGEDRPQEGALVLRHNPVGGKPKLLSFNVDRNTPLQGSKGFSHPDMLPLLIANTFGNKHSSP